MGAWYVSLVLRRVGGIRGMRADVEIVCEAQGKSLHHLLEEPEAQAETRLNNTGKGGMTGGSV
jgi:hypothetical protein